MAYAAKIILDSITAMGHRLTTFEVTLPRIVLAEFNTHCMFARNSASSRAIPVEKMIRMVEEDPYIPESWGKNQKGMVAEEDLSPIEQQTCENVWLKGRDEAVTTAKRLLEIGVHKQLTNRLLEPFLWHTIVVTATEYSNFFNLRDDKNAHPAIQKPARMMRELYNNSTPGLVQSGSWHDPYVDDETAAAVLKTTMSTSDTWSVLKEISSARCAAVSYMRQEVRDIPAELKRYASLLSSGHMSPFEHPARPMTHGEYDLYLRWDYIMRTAEGTLHRICGSRWDLDAMKKRGYDVVHAKATYFCGKYNGWIAHRKEIPFEDDIRNGTVVIDKPISL